MAIDNDQGGERLEMNFRPIPKVNRMMPAAPGAVWVRGVQFGVQLARP